MNYRRVADELSTQGRIRKDSYKKKTETTDRLLTSFRRIRELSTRYRRISDELWLSYRRSSNFDELSRGYTQAIDQLSTTYWIYDSEILKNYRCPIGKLNEDFRRDIYLWPIVEISKSYRLTMIKLSLFYWTICQTVYSYRLAIDNFDNYRYIDELWMIWRRVIESHR